MISHARVSAIRDGLVEVSDGRKIEATTLVWAAGNAPNRLIADLLRKKSGRIEVNEYLEDEGCDGIWPLGDCAAIPAGKAGFHPPAAQHALREGPMRSPQRIRRDSLASQEAFSICDIGQVGGDRQSQRSREYFRDQFLKIFRLVALADDLPLQVAAFREEGTCRPRLDARPVLRKGFCLRHVESSGAVWRISSKERTGRIDPERGVPSREISAADRGMEL